MNKQQFIENQENLLESIEQDIFREVEVTMNFAISRMEELGPDASADQYEQALAPLNDLLPTNIGSVLFQRQRTITAQLADFPGAVPILLKSPQELLDTPLMGDTISSNFERRSPSRWMQNLFGATRKAIEHQVESIIAGAVWAVTADLTLQTLPQVSNGSGSPSGMSVSASCANRSTVFRCHGKSFERCGQDTLAVVVQTCRFNPVDAESQGRALLWGVRASTTVAAVSGATSPPSP